MSINKTKIFFLVLGVIIIVELFIGIRTVLTTKSSHSQTAQPAPLTGGQIALVVPTASYTVGSKIPLSIRVSTGGRTTDGTDVVLKYDPRMLDASPSGFVPGTIYPDYPLVNVDSKAGIIRISGISGPSQSGFSGVGVFGTLTFTAKSKGATPVTVDFKPNMTTESNIVESKTSKDIIESVTDTSILIN